MKWSYKIVFSIAAALLFIISDVSAAGQRVEITVSAAMSLRAAFEELSRLFEADNSGAGVRLNFGGSGTLKRQIMGGAPVDVFASASLRDMQGLADAGLLNCGTWRSLASNRMVLIVPRGHGLTVKSFRDLLNGEVERIAVGNPATVPAGRYAEEIMEDLNVYGLLKQKLIFAENVRQVLDYVARGEADAGVVYATDARIRAVDVRVAAYAGPESHSPVVYPIAPVCGTKNKRLVNGFIALALSGEGQEILRKYGFDPLPGDK